MRIHENVLVWFLMINITDIKGTVKLNNGVDMPYLGLGVFNSNEGREVKEAIHIALHNGYRLIDTAKLYGNEIGVGEAVRTTDVPRKKIFVTSKVWNNDQGYDKTLKAFDSTMKRLALDYLDLYLIHWPVKGKYKETWKALEEIYRAGLVRAIGVSNFMQHHLEDLLKDATVVPALNQIEFHPYLTQPTLLDYCQSKGIWVQAWSPLMQGGVFNIPELKELADKYGKTVPQIVLRWNLQKGVCTIPKSSNEDRIRENADLFNFEISADDIKKIDALDRQQREGADPDNFSF
jgi:diketogulonate reductase-like aldo/keto reductase